MSDETFKVKIEPSRLGGYLVTVTGPGIGLADFHHCDTRDQCREWAADHVMWVQTKAPAEEYEIPPVEIRPESLRVGAEATAL